MKKFLTFVMLFALMGFSVGCERVPPEVAAQREVFVEQLQTLRAGDLVVKHNGDVKIVRFVCDSCISFEGRSVDDDLVNIAAQTKEIILMTDPRWADTLRNYYKGYRRTDGQKESTTTRPATTQPEYGGF